MLHSFKDGSWNYDGNSRLDVVKKCMYFGDGINIFSNLGL